MAVNELLEEARTIANDRRPKEKHFRTVRSYVESFGKTTVGYYDTIKRGIEDNEDPGLKEGAWKAFRGSVLETEKVNRTKLVQLDAQYLVSYKAANDWATKVRLSRKRISFDMLRNGVPLTQLRDPYALGEWIQSLRGTHFIIRGSALIEGLTRHQQDLHLTHDEWVWWSASICFLTGMTALEQFNMAALDDSLARLKYLCGEVPDEYRSLGSNEVSYFYSTLRTAKERLTEQLEEINSVKLLIRTAVCRHAHGEDYIGYYGLNTRTDPMTVDIVKGLNDEHVRTWQWTFKWRKHLIGIEMQAKGTNLRPGFVENHFERDSAWIKSHINKIKEDNKLSRPELAVALASLDPRMKDVAFSKDCLSKSLKLLQEDYGGLNVPNVVEFYECCSKLFEATGYTAAALRSQDRIEKIYRMAKDERNLALMQRKEDERIGTVTGAAIGTIAPEDIKDLLDEVKQPTLIVALMP
ncbi:MAG: hypothetical protein ABL893_04720 [Hyphomicrobium sp.]|nr:hypothetical protein [Hyphomicrobium sp.]